MIARRVVLSAALGVVAAVGSARATEVRLWSELPSHARKIRPPLADLAERARRAVVHVRGTLVDMARAPDGGKPGAPVVSVGSGFFVDRSGYLVTNEHVVRNTADVRIKMHDGRELSACVIGADEVTDLALLRVQSAAPVPVLPLGNSDHVHAGEVAIAIGSPFGFSHSVTAGIVSAKERVIEQPDGRVEEEIPPDGSRNYAFFIQTDAAINVGNSGGPLLDGHGAVIGINAAFWGGGQSAQGVSFAIPINIAKLLLPRLVADGEAPRSYLGVDGQPITASLATALRLPAVRGALIAAVESGTAAAAAGLEPGDVVVAWNGRLVATDEDFKIYAQLTRPGSRVQVRVLRGGQIEEHTVITRTASEPRPVRPAHPASCKSIGGTMAMLPDGFEARDVPAARAKGLPEGPGVEVVRVVGGGAREAGLLPGDVILRVGRKVVHTAAQMRRAFDDAPAGSPLPLLVRRWGSDFWTALPRR